MLGEGYTGPYKPRRARDAEYVLRTSGIAADTITVTAMQGESPVFDLNLANGTVAIPIRGMRFPPYTYRNAVRESLKWATCDPCRVVQKLKFCNIMRCIRLTLKVAGYLEKIQTHLREQPSTKYKSWWHFRCIDRLFHLILWVLEPTH